MEKVIRVAGTAAPLPLDDIDTDALAPTAFVTRADVDFGRALFGNWRYLDKSAAEERPDFILNQPAFRQARILVAGANFGCGSSREHAVWTLMGFGIRAVLAVGFGDIFFENACKNGLLPIALPRETIDRIGRELGQGGNQMVVDLEALTITLPGGEIVGFGFDPARRTALMAGLDEIGMTLEAAAEIAAFQAADRTARPWIYGVRFLEGDP